MILYIPLLLYNMRQIAFTIESSITTARYLYPYRQCHVSSTYQNAGWKLDSQPLQRKQSLYVCFHTANNLLHSLR
jgi:hypothetical protein